MRAPEGQSVANNSSSNKRQYAELSREDLRFDSRGSAILSWKNTKGKEAMI